MIRLVIIFIFSSYSVLQAAEVIRVAKNKRDMAISIDQGNPWHVGQKVCVEGQQGNKVCGEVVKLGGRGAICRMQADLDGIVPGDKVDSESKRTMGVGIRGGLNLANINTADPILVGTKNRVALDAGVLLNLPVGKGGLGFETSLNFSQKGYETSVSALGLNYLDLRLLMNIRVMKGNFTPIFYLGPYVAFLLSAESSDVNGSTNVKDSFKSLDFGLVGGAGVEFQVSQGLKLGVSGYYSLGLRAIEDNLLGVEDLYPTKNKGILILTQVIFNI